MAVNRADVEALSSTSWSKLGNDKKDALLADAKREKDTIYSARVSTLPTLEGDEDVFVKNLAAHKWEIAQGGSAQSESATGGSVNYNLGSPTEVSRYLSLTNYGETCKAHLRDEAGIGLVRTR